MGILGRLISLVAGSGSQIFWTVRARRKLEQSLAHRLAAGHQLETIMAELNLDDRLRQIFPENKVTIVQDLYVGFRPRADQFILLVEIDHQQNPGPRVVKLAPTKNLREELAAWESCRPFGLGHDLVLMMLQPRYHRGELVGLVYGDASHAIGVDVTCPFEEAVLNAVLHGTPSVLSVRFALIQLYERLYQLLHRVSDEDKICQSTQGPHVTFPHLWKCLQLWQAGFRAADRQHLIPHLQPRASAVAIRRRPGNSDRPEFKYRDPVDYLVKYVKPFTVWKVERRECEASDSRDAILICIDPSAHFPDGSKPDLARLIPRLRRGRVHGDLHGRNIQVGIANGQVHWPSVFDFEDMQPGGLIGLDFVKLEVELKIRALPRIFDQPAVEEDSIRFQEFEHSLNEWSEYTQSNESWPRFEELAGWSPPGRAPSRVPRAESERQAHLDERLARLRTILLEIRRLASLVLGVRAGRPTEWLREYLFLQLCYALTTVRFENLTQRELSSAFIAAGVAVPRL